MGLNTCAVDAALERGLGALGYPGFKRGQLEVLRSVLAGVDTLAVMPTGAGKSLCYQLPALLLPGVTLVVSPLLALMHEQVVRAQARGLRAQSLTSLDDGPTKTAKLEALRRGEVQLCYVSPEGLQSDGVQAALCTAGVSLMAVDEAHCISAWGHDFRAHYARLGWLRGQLGPQRVLALTATATPEVQEDIVRALHMHNARVVVTGFDRDNLILGVERLAHGARAARLQSVLGDALNSGGRALVYCTSRNAAARVALELCARGHASVAYHAGMSGEERATAVERWEGGQATVMCATNAFGMGVDRPDVRVVVHLGVPRSPEAYYQEVGRAGRDGASARGVLMYDTKDVALARRRVLAASPDAACIRNAYARCLSLAAPDGVLPDLAVVKRCLSAWVGAQAAAAWVHLQALGAVTVVGQVARVAALKPGGLDVQEAALQQHAQAQRQRLRAMEDYLRGGMCRRGFLVSYFTLAPLAPCGVCDVCLQGALRALTPEERRDALMALSCVARMLGRFGRGRVVEVLVGSRNAPLQRARLHELSTHGLLRHLGKRGVTQLLGALERAGLVSSMGEAYPLLDLTAAGARAMESGNIPPLWPQHIQGHDPTPDPEALGAQLAHWNGWGVALPSPVGAQTLAALCHLKPRTLEELRIVPGLAPLRGAQGEELLRLIHRV